MILRENFVVKGEDINDLDAAKVNFSDDPQWELEYEFSKPDQLEQWTIISLNYPYDILIDKNKRTIKDNIAYYKVVGFSGNYILKEHHSLSDIFNSGLVNKQIIGSVYLAGSGGAGGNYLNYEKREKSYDALWDFAVIMFVEKLGENEYVLLHNLSFVKPTQRIQVAKNLFIDLDEDNNYCASWYFGKLPENLLSRLKERKQKK